MLCPFVAMAQQNHVYNGSFEHYTNCPNGLGQINNCAGWANYNTGSVDYNNACHTGSTCGVPSNNWGYQQAASGQAYASMLDYTITGASGSREYMTSYMNPLTPGKMYEISLSMVVGDYSKHFNDGLCVHFFDTGVTQYPSSIAQLGIVPKVNFLSYGVMSDTQNWTRLTGYYLPDSAYDHIVIGYFLDGQMTTVNSNFTTVLGYGYVLIDSVVVREYDSLNVTVPDSFYCTGDTIKASYTVWRRKISGNVFTLQLSDASGSFATPVNIGILTTDTAGMIKGVIPANTPTGTGYRLRIIASNFADTSNVISGLKIGHGPIAKPVATNNGPLCIGQTLLLGATSSATGVTWSWTGPNNFTSSFQFPSITNAALSTGGKYVATSKLYGCTARDTTEVYIFGPVSVSGDLATGNGPVCQYDTIRLNSNVTGSSLSYSWSGPSGFSSTLPTPVIYNASAAQTGDYILYVTNGACSARDTVYIQVNPRPANVSATYNGPVCSGQNIALSATSSTSGVSWSWTGPNSFSSASAGPNILASLTLHSGDYIATATLNGCTGKDTVTVLVKQSPEKPVATVNGPICAGETMNLVATTSTGGVSWGWTGPNSYSAATQNTSITNTTTGMSGDYIVTATLNGCSTKDTVTATVKPMPVAVTLTGYSSRCVGDTVYVGMSNSTTGSSYSWTGPNSFSSSSQNTFVANSTTAASGWYKGTVNLNGCLYKDSISITVYPIPPAPKATHGSPLCVGEMLQLSAGNVAGAAYKWTGPNSYTGTTQNSARNNMQFSDTGLYHVTATVDGCTSPAGSTRVLLNAQPFVAVSVTPGDTICAGQSATFTAFPNNHGGTPVYQWHINGIPAGTGGTAYSSTTLNHMDIVSCVMTEKTKCSAAFADTSNAIEMKVLPWLAPSVSIAASTTQPLKENEYITFTATPTNAGAIPKYQWKRNGQNIVGATGAVWSANTLNDNDDICVQVISTYKCPQPLTAMSNCIKVKVLSGVEDMAGNSRLMLYPNPNKGSFTISGQVATHKPVNLSIVNALGQEVHTQSATTDNGQLEAQVQTSGLAAGIYLLRLQNEQINTQLKFSIQ